MKKGTELLLEFIDKEIEAIALENKRPLREAVEKMGLDELVSLGKSQASAEDYDCSEVKINRGDIVEGIVAAAIAASFYNRGGPVKAGEIFWWLEEGSGEFELPGDKNISIDFTSRVAGSGDEHLKDIRFIPCLIGEYEGTLKYVNEYATSIVRKTIEGIQKDGEPHTIYIGAEGTSDQKGTKADVKLYLDDSPIAGLKPLSLKTKGGEQFFQVAIADPVAGLDKMFNDILKLGINVSGFKKYYDNEPGWKTQYSARISQEGAKKDPRIMPFLEKAISEYKKVYQKEVYTKLSQLLKDPEYIKTTLASAIMKGMVGKEDIVMLKVDNRAGRYFVRNREAISKLAEKDVFDFKTELADEKGWPEIKINVVNKTTGKEYELLKIRTRADSAKSRASGKYSPWFRHLMSTGSGFFDFDEDVAWQISAS
jgi:hypothetical protein